MLCHHFQSLLFDYIPKVFAFPIKGSINFNTTPQEQQFASMPCLGTFQESEAHQMISGTKEQKYITKLIKEHKQVHKDRETQIQNYKITQL